MIYHCFLDDSKDQKQERMIVSAGFLALRPTGVVYGLNGASSYIKTDWSISKPANTKPWTVSLLDSKPATIRPQQGAKQPAQSDQGFWNSSRDIRRFTALESASQLWITTLSATGPKPKKYFMAILTTVLLKASCLKQQKSYG